MFTGLVEEKGVVSAIENIGQGLRFTIKADQVLQQMAPGDSIAVNGVCLTVVEAGGDSFTVEAVGETLNRTNLSQLMVGAFVNLERALKLDSRLGGHFVQGHIDGVGQIINIEVRDPGLWLEVRISDHLAKFVVEKGSICLDGVSLTVAEVNGPVISIAVIPFTVELTTIGLKKIGDELNVETDVLAKYVDRMMNAYRQDERISYQKLAEWGYE